MAWRLTSGHGLLIFVLLMSLWLSETGQIGDLGAFPGKNALREWPKILHADGSWPPGELIKLWARYIVSFLALLSFSETGQIWGFRAFPGTCTIYYVCDTECYGHLCGPTFTWHPGKNDALPVHPLYVYLPCPSFNVYFTRQWCLTKVQIVFSLYVLCLVPHTQPVSLNRCLLRLLK